MDESVTQRTAASKQKNCNNCVQGKRRCDRRRPVCSRCSKSNLACAYTGYRKPVDRTELLGDPNTPLHGDIVIDETRAQAFGNLQKSDDQHTDAMVIDNCIDPTLTTSLFGAGSGFGDECPEFFLSHAQFQDHEAWTVSTKVSGDTSPFKEDESGVRDSKLEFKNMSSFCDNINSWSTHDPSSSLHYMLQRIKGFPMDIGRRNASPFMHRFLYRDNMPQRMISCFTICVLYANRTPENMSMVLRALHDAVQELIQIPAGASIDDSADLLSRCQALFIYQMIRLFDGDILLRTQGEKDMTLILSWLAQLCCLRNNLNNEQILADIGDWNSWIFAECMRRLIVMAYSVIGLYTLIKGSDSKEGIDIWSMPHRWTMSKHLWEADTPESFHAAWKVKPRYIITNYTFDDFLQLGTGDDVDEFGELLLNAQVCHKRELSGYLPSHLDIWVLMPQTDL